MSKLLRGGRIGSTREDVVTFCSSIESDQILLDSIIKINQAHVIMLIEQKIINSQIGSKLLEALIGIDSNKKLDQNVEDVHLAVEEEVNNKVGTEIGGNLHLAKSRNDQVATAIRMELRKQFLKLISFVTELQDCLIELADKHTETLVPSYTHLHPAQPITFAHLLSSYNTAFQRNVKRLEETFPRINMCPMGAGAIATTSFPINRTRIANLLGFDKVIENSIDAVGSRDFILETLAHISLLAIDISRVTEDLLIWNSPDFGIIELPESFAFTSSIMPQKKNPDVLEVIRARMSHILGNFTASIMTMKALPSGYNLDMQEITPKLWESIGIITSCLDMLSKLVKELKINKHVFEKQILNHSTTTELANLLVKKFSIPFRVSHRIVGSIVKTLLDKKLTISDLTPELLTRVIEDYTGINITIKIEDIENAIDPKNFVESHKTLGGPAPTEVKRMLSNCKQLNKQSKIYQKELKSRLKEADEHLKFLVQRYKLNEI